MGPRFLSPEQREECGRRFHVDGISSSILSKQFKISPSAVRKFGSIVRRGLKFHSREGRPAVLEPEHENELSEYLKTNRISRTTEDTRAKVSELVKKTHIVRGHRGVIKRQSKRTLDRLEKRLSINTHNAEVGTKARIEACQDVRHMCSYVAMSQYADNLTGGHGTLKCNADGTCFTVGFKMKDTEEVKTVGPKLKGKSYKTAPLENRTSGLFTIKMYFLAFANGQCAELIYIIEDKTMEKFSMDIHKVPGLGLGTTEESNYGYVIFVPDRTLFTAFYVWFLKEILIPMCIRMRAMHGHSPDTKIFFAEDGEDVQIKCYLDPEIRKLCEDNNIVIGKSASSSTEIQQALDRGNLFKGTKSRLAAISNDDIVKQYLYLKEQLVRVWKLHEERHGIGITVDHRKAGINGIIKVYDCLTYTISKSTIVDSFKFTGSHPYNIEQIMNECTATIPREQDIIIRRNKDYLVQTLRDEGEIFEAIYDNCGILDNIARGGKPKDQLVIMRRRCLILTNNKFYEREIAKVEIAKQEVQNKIKAREARELKKVENKKIREQKLIQKSEALEIKEKERKRKLEFNQMKKEQRLFKQYDKPLKRAGNNNKKITEAN